MLSCVSCSLSSFFSIPANIAAIIIVAGSIGITVEVVIVWGLTLTICAITDLPPRLNAPAKMSGVFLLNALSVSPARLFIGI